MSNLKPIIESGNWAAMRYISKTIGRPGCFISKTIGQGRQRSEVRLKMGGL